MTRKQVIFWGVFFCAFGLFGLYFMTWYCHTYWVDPVEWYVLPNSLIGWLLTPAAFGCGGILLTGACVWKEEGKT